MAAWHKQVVSRAIQDSQCKHRMGENTGALLLLPEKIQGRSEQATAGNPEQKHSNAQRVARETSERLSTQSD